MRVALKTLGCRLNEAEIQSWSRDFRKNGLTVVNDDTRADLLVINTCAVTQEAVRKSRHLIRRSQKNNPSAKLIVSGCYASLDQDIN
ncbi:MAG: tRNA (N(6)-L-threonylcarbamoyladenosine(37)-C(2))-methylthiotransferase MtaB, partial [Thiotrichales bacterium]|nr:tRNA (N(6)-L-threonylcarbamoyladenosine(37)-C(2))-methylthiotransferase MtaB [Thiotrichales bacterium]